MNPDMPRPFLLDVNVLIALFDSAHVHHRPAHAWFASARPQGWRTCPVTENAFLRILSHPAYPNSPLPVLDLAGRLEELKQSATDHDFWPDDVSLSRWVQQAGQSLSSSRVTDAALLKLAATRHGTLATFDLRITPSLIGESDPALVEHIPVS